MFGTCKRSIGSITLIGARSTRDVVRTLERLGGRCALRRRKQLIRSGCWALSLEMASSSWISERVSGGEAPQCAER